MDFLQDVMSNMPSAASPITEKPANQVVPANLVELPKPIEVLVEALVEVPASPVKEVKVPVINVDADSSQMSSSSDEKEDTKKDLLKKKLEELKSKL